MLHLATVGTNWITEQFIEAAHLTRKYQLSAVYSRNLATAQEFSKKFSDHVACFDHYPTMLENESIDVIYIASPNSLHFLQAKAAIEAGKHVIIEKPACSNIKQWNELMALAEKYHVGIFEAARNIHEYNFQVLKESLPLIGDILGANFTFMKYSSRYDQVLDGYVPNIFSLDFSGGALMDLGIYLLYASFDLFGVPCLGTYHAQKIVTGVDGIGNIELTYPNFQVQLATGKIADSFLPSEIYGTKGTLRLNGIADIETLTYYDRDADEVRSLPVKALGNPMSDEAEAFAEVILHFDLETSQKKYHSWLNLATEVHQWLTDLRKGAGIIFSEDHDE